MMRIMNQRQQKAKQPLAPQQTLLKYQLRLELVLQAVRKEASYLRLQILTSPSKYTVCAKAPMKQT